MNKCKNISCNNKTEGKKVYCSLKCRNYYVNKYLRDYNKNSNGLSKDSKEKYELSPKFCLRCDEKIPYIKRRNGYCGHKCAVTQRNLGNILSEETKQKMRKSAILNLGELKIVFCKNCKKEILLKERKIYCDDNCKLNFRRKDMSDFLKYKKDANFKFSLNDFPDEFEFQLITDYGWYAPSNSKKPNIGGISRDHMISISEGFKLNIDPKLISHPANCKLMIHNENIGKNKNSSLTIAELLEKINKWNLKYGDYQ